MVCKYDSNFHIARYLRLALWSVLLRNTASVPGTFCTGDWHFTYATNTLQSYSPATDTCNADGAYMATVSTTSLAQEIKENVPEGMRYWVAAKRCATNYCWTDGTIVSSDFTITHPGGSFGDCLRLFVKSGTASPAFESLRCETKQRRLCQKRKTPPAVSRTSLIIRDATAHSIDCTTAICSPTWISEDGAEIPQTADAQLGVRQQQTNTISKFWLQNPTETASGIYHCKTLQDRSTFQTVHITVQGRPSIRTVMTSKCTSNVTLIWTPNKYALNDTHKIMTTDGQIFDVIPEAYIEQNFSISTLAPSTEFALNITTCIQNCILNFSPSVTSFMTGGIPNKVQTLTSRQEDNMTCIITWLSPPTSVDVTTYQIHIQETAIMVRPNSSYERSWSNETERMIYDFTLSPNMMYNISISAENCGGMGDAAFFLANCRVPQSAPENVPAPQIMNTGNLLLPNISLNVPNESTGLLSCLLVMISSDANEPALISSATVNYYTKEFISLLSQNNQSNEYVALAIPPNRFINSDSNPLLLTIGDNSTSSCNLTESSSDWVPRNDICEQGMICALNRQLQNMNSYRAYVIGVVYSDDMLSVRRSGDGTFDTWVESGSSSFTNILVGSIGGVAFALLLVLVVAIIVKRQRKKKSYSGSKDPTSNHENAIYELPALPSVAGNNGPSRKPPRSNTRLESRSAEGLSEESRMDVPNSDSQILYENLDKKNTPSTVIQLQHLEALYNRNRKNNNAGFYRQYQDILKASAQRVYCSRVASDPLLKSKNRYKNILPYDSSRVVLEGTPTGYINACYVDGYTAKKKFIATQGPLPKTLGDFWCMIFEKRCPIIVMLTKPMESGKKKCEKYWPKKGHAVSFESLSVENLEEYSRGGYVCRNFKISDGESTVLTTQYHFLNWPDHGTPQNTTHLVHLHGAIMREFQQLVNTGPIVIHCSAGAGRTGTFIGYDNLLEQSSKTGGADFFTCVMKMREQRVDMVQNTGQYTFLHKLLLESYLHGDTDLQTSGFRQMYKDISRPHTANELRNQFEIVGRVPPMKYEILEIGATDYVDVNFRDAAKINVYSRVRIVMTEDDNESPVFDGSWIETEDESLPVIATSTPTKSTSDLFWRAVMDNSVGTIVSLSLPTPDDSDSYYPENTENAMVIKGGAVSLISYGEEGKTRKRILEVDISGRKSLVTLLQCNAWEDILRPEDNEIFSLFNLIKTTAQKAHKKVILVHCSDGIGRTGVFCAIVNLLDRIRSENRIDIPRAVKDLKDARPMMVKNQEQYDLCYKIIQKYLDSIEVYSVA